MKPWRHPLFLKAYGGLPHPLLDRSIAWLMRRERPRWLVDALIAGWIRRGAIAMADFEPGPFASAEAFFLRRLAPGARPIAALAEDQPTSPVDGVVVSEGHDLVVKGQRLSLATLCGRPSEAAATLSIFLTPDGYHHVHAPLAGVVRAVRPIAGRTFPQNDDALGVRPDVYLRNARVVVEADGWTLVLVAASLIAHIEVDVQVGDNLSRGDMLGRFRFGSTVVLLLPAAHAWHHAAGAVVRLGEAL